MDFPASFRSFYWVNKVAVVTGASAGIGASIALELANAGMLVVGLARRVEKIQDLAEQVTGTGKIFPRCCDVTDERSVAENFQWIRDNLHAIHVLINNAGINRAALLCDSSHAEIAELFQVNVVAAANCMRIALQHMRDLKVRCHIIVLNSILGQRIPDVPVPLFNVYPATKHAITALCQTTRQEIHFLKLNIKLTSISPGMVDTDFLKVYSHAAECWPKLKTKDVVGAIMYTLNTPDYVQVEDITLQAMQVPEDAFGKERTECKNTKALDEEEEDMQDCGCAYKENLK